MKKTYVVLLLLLAVYFSFAQAPQGINYQAVIRDVSGSILANQNVAIKINIRAGGASGNISYSETHNAITNAYGLINLVIGQGNAQLGAFNAISWGANTHFVEIQADITGGTNYLTIGNQQLMSVPYALYAEKTGQTYTAGSGISINGNTITNTNPDQTVSLTGTGGTNVTGSYPNFTVNSQIPINYTAGTGIAINGNTITNTSPNQNQTLSVSGNTLTISGGNSVTIASSASTSLQQIRSAVQFSAIASVTNLTDISSNPAGDTMYLLGKAGGYSFHQYVLNPVSGLYDWAMTGTYGSSSWFYGNAVYMGGKLYVIAGVGGNNSVYQFNPTNFSANPVAFTTVGAPLGTKLITDGTYLYSNSSTNGYWTKFAVTGTSIVNSGTIALPSNITDAIFDGTNTYLISDSEVSNWAQTSIYPLGDMGGIGLMTFSNNKIAYISEQTLVGQKVYYTINIVGKP